MPKDRNLPTVLCTFDKEEECLEEMIQSSFRAFIHRYLQNSADFLTKRP